MKRAILLMLLTTLSLATYSQDTLSKQDSSTRAKVFPIVHNGEVLLAMDTITGKEFAHELNEGKAAKEELSYCDSARLCADSALASQVKINKNLSLQLDNVKSQNQKEKDKNVIWKNKFDASENEKKRFRRNMWIAAGCGTAGGVVAGIIVGVLLNNK